MAKISLFDFKKVEETVVEERPAVLEQKTETEEPVKDGSTEVTKEESPVIVGSKFC